VVLSKYLLSSVYLSSLLAIFIGENSAWGTPLPGCIISEGTKLTVSEIESKIRDPQCQIKSIDDVLGLLPGNMRSNFSLVYQSKSLQGPHRPDYLNPRAILQSGTIDSGFYLTFNGMRNQAGYNTLEMLQVDVAANDPAKIFQYFEIEFPKDEDASQSQTWDEVQSQIKFSQANPSRCTACHGAPARPIYPGYPLWEGSYGSRHMRIDKNEEQGLNAFISSTSLNSQSRYRHLDFDGLNQNYYGEGLAALLDGKINGRVNNDLSAANGYRLAEIIRKTPEYDKFRHAIAGALLDCPDYASFFPVRTSNRIDKNLNAIFNLGKNYGKQGAKIVLDLFWQDGPHQFGDIMNMTGATTFGPADPPKDETDLAKRLFEYAGKSKTMYALTLDTLKRQGRQRSNSIPVKIRYVMEGRGIDITSWFMDLAQPSYRLMDSHWGGEQILWPLLKRDPGFADIRDEALSIQPQSNSKIRKNVCDQLQKKSATALLKAPPIPGYSRSPFELSNPPGDYPAVFSQVCTKCHVQESIGPRIPFDDPHAFKTWLSNPINYREIKYRLYAPDDRRMPPTKILTSNELDLITRYLDSGK